MKNTRRDFLNMAAAGAAAFMLPAQAASAGSWKCVATQSTPAENAVIFATVTPGSGVYDLGWFALVEQPVMGSVISIR
jgi:hypothetical protein